MKKLMIIIFAVSLFAACNKPDPDDEWIEYLQRYKWEHEGITISATGELHTSDIEIIWEFYETYLTHYSPDYPEHPPYTINIVYNEAAKGIAYKGDGYQNPKWRVEIDGNRLRLIEENKYYSLKKGKKK